LKGAVKRSLSVFNTNPCFSGFVAGAVIEQEAHGRTDEAQHQAGVERMKSMLGGTFGALGDDLMWFSLKPFLGTLAVLLFLLGHEWAFVWMVGVFSISNIALRFKGLELGLKGVLAVQQFLQKIKPNRIAAELKRATCVLLGAVVGVLLSAPHEHSAQGAGFWFGAAIVVPVIAACFLLRSRDLLMREERITIKDEFGMHLRSIMSLVEAAKSFESEISVRFGDEAADGKSPWALLALGVVAGSHIMLRVDGPDEDDAMAKLLQLAENSFVPLNGSEKDK
jgi:phosphotransferase system HPr (HPr) family protein